MSASAAPTAFCTQGAADADILHFDPILELRFDEAPVARRVLDVSVITMFNRKPLVVAVVPAFVVGIIFEIFIGLRHDYTGHYAAGYGAGILRWSRW